MKLNIKKYQSIILILLFTILNVNASDITTIYNRMYVEYLANPSPANVSTVLNKMNEDGSFQGIDYKTKESTPRNHPIMLATLASAYKNPENKYYQNAELKSKYLLSLKFWIDTNHQSWNWFHRTIAYPKELCKSVILMRDEIKADKELFDKTIKYLRWSYENTKPNFMTGANGADIVMGSMAASVITENHQQMLEYKNKMTELVTIQANEGILDDYMYAQHCQYGRQLYLTNYGKEYLNSLFYYFEFCDKTEYSTPGLSLIEDFFIKGVQWVFFSKQYDPNQAGRYDNSDISYGKFVNLSDRLQKLNVTKKEELKKVNNRIKGENSLSGNRMFWRFDYMINRRTNYMVSTRMSSTRTVGSEAGNGDGNFNYYSGNGTNYIFVSGKEYNGKFFKKFNNRQFPGITAEQDDAVLPVPKWGLDGGNGNAFAGGVSDSTYGACGMILQRRGVTARKSWFYFDDEFVCLGAGIRQTEGKANVYSTINQCNADGKVQYSENGVSKTLKDKATIKSANWILHGKVGYFNLNPVSNLILACDSNLFSLNINHGTNPDNAEYAYLVKPNTENEIDANEYLAKKTVTILKNKPEIQAVRNNSLKINEIIFYTAGQLSISNEQSISVDAPCAVLWNEQKAELTLANPLCESNNPATIKVIIKQKGLQKEILFQMPTGAKAGSSQTKKYK